MTKRNPCLEAARRVLDDMGIPYRIEIGTKAIKVHFSYQGRLRFVRMSKTPSARQAPRAVEGDLKKIFSGIYT